MRLSSIDLRAPSLRHALGVVALFVGCLGASAKGEIVLSNLESGAFPGISDVELSRWWANSFMTDNRSSTLNSATLKFADVFGATSGSVGLFVGVYSDASGVPGSSLDVLSGNSTPTTQGEYSYSSATGISLAPSTTYWLVAGVQVSGKYGWLYEETENVEGFVGPWSVSATNTYAFSDDQGSNWSPGAGYPLFFSIDATVASVPEIDPAGMGTVLALVTGALGLLERRRLKAKLA